ncbi:hypothetical protein ACVWXO_010799 [Bradyrhizobium sp. LM2.7]
MRCFCTAWHASKDERPGRWPSPFEASATLRHLRVTETEIVST